MSLPAAPLSILRWGTDGLLVSFSKLTALAFATPTFTYQHKLTTHSSAQACARGAVQHLISASGSVTVPRPLE